MAAAYRVVDRIHAPLTSPLEDPNPTIAHLKIHWPSSFQRLQEITLQSNFYSGTDYSNIKPHVPRLGADNLLVFNVYKTTDSSPSWGLGPSPLSPLYICYPVLHPADWSLPSPPKPGSLPSPSVIFSPNKDRGLPAHRQNLIQFFLDRKDFLTHIPSTMVCVRFLEEFVEWRLISKSHSPAKAKANKSSANQRDVADVSVLETSKLTSFFGRIALKKAASMNALRNVFPCPTPPPTTPSEGHGQQRPDSFARYHAENQLKDVPAAHIFLNPTIRLVDQRPSKPLVNLFTSFASELGAGSLPMYTTIEEVAGQTGIELFFSPGTEKKTYWWVCENTSWKVVFDPTEKPSTKNSKKTTNEQKDKGANTSREVSRSGRPVARNDAAGEASERNHNSEPPSPSLGSYFKRSYTDINQRSSSWITCGTVKLYVANQLEPVASVELSTGQMWIVKSVLLNTIDIVVAIMFAVVNLERAIIEEHE